MRGLKTLKGQAALGKRGALVREWVVSKTTGANKTEALEHRESESVLKTDSLSSGLVDWLFLDALFAWVCDWDVAVLKRQ